MIIWYSRTCATPLVCTFESPRFDFALGIIVTWPLGNAEKIGVIGKLVTFQLYYRRYFWSTTKPNFLPSFTPLTWQERTNGTHQESLQVCVRWMWNTFHLMYSTVSSSSVRGNTMLLNSTSQNITSPIPSLRSKFLLIKYFGEFESNGCLGASSLMMMIITKNIHF